MSLTGLSWLLYASDLCLTLFISQGITIILVPLPLLLAAYPVPPGPTNARASSISSISATWYRNELVLAPTPTVQPVPWNL